MRLTIKHDPSKNLDHSIGPTHQAGTKRAQEGGSERVLLLIRSSGIAHALETSTEELRERVLQFLSGATPLVPSVRVREGAEGFMVSVRLPDIDAESVAVAFAGGAIRITGTWTRKREFLRRKYRRVEATVRTFERTISMPSSFEPGKAIATFSRDVLRVSVPRPDGREPKPAADGPAVTATSVAAE